MDLLLNAVLVTLGLAMLCFGGSWLVSGGISVARKLGVSPLVIGITVVAMGTSAPELAASLAAGENGEIILGNVVGSNVANVGMVVGITAIMAPLVMKRRALKKDVPIMIGFSLLLVGLSADGQISHLDGVALVATAAGFTLYMYRSSRGEAEDMPGGEAATDGKRNNTPRAALLIAGGIALLAVGALLTIDNAVSIARAFEISDRYIGLTVIAIGTSLPELITSIIAVRRRHADIGIGNIIGSNVYNILMIVGITAAISGIAAAPHVLVDYAVMIAFSASLLAGLRSGIIGRGIGAGLVAAYAAYLASSLYIA